MRYGDVKMVSNKWLEEPLYCKITDVRNNVTSVLQLPSKFTCIYGKFSAEGKTTFIETFEEKLGTGDVTVECSEGYSFVYGSNALLSLTEKCIVLVDELILTNKNSLKVALNSNNVFICISRYNTFQMGYALSGVYRMDTQSVSMCHFIPTAELPITKDLDNDYTIIITESCKERSECKLLMHHFSNNIIAGDCNTSAVRKARDTDGKLLLVLDLYNISSILADLYTLCEENVNVHVYAYGCFEELLYNSRLTESLCELRTVPRYRSRTLERAFEHAFEVVTRKANDIHFSHGKEIPKAWLNIDNSYDVFASDIGYGFIYLYKTVPQSVALRIMQDYVNMLDLKSVEDTTTALCQYANVEPNVVNACGVLLKKRVLSGIYERKQDDT